MSRAWSFTNPICQHQSPMPASSRWGGYQGELRARICLDVSDLFPAPPVFYSQVLSPTPGGWEGATHLFEPFQSIQFNPQKAILFLHPALIHQFMQHLVMSCDLLQVQWAPTHLETNATDKCCMPEVWQEKVGRGLGQAWGAGDSVCMPGLPGPLDYALQTRKAWLSLLSLGPLCLAQDWKIIWA